MKRLGITIAAMVIYSSIALGQGNNYKLNGNNNGTTTSVLGFKNNADVKVITRDSVRLTVKKDGDVEIEKNLVVKGKLSADSIHINEVNTDSMNITHVLTADSIHVRAMKIGTNSLYIGGQLTPTGTTNNILSSDGLLNLGGSPTFSNIQVGIGKTNPGYALDVNDDINVSYNKGYRISGEIVLQKPGSTNIFVGKGAGVSNTGINNSFLGEDAGYSNLGGSGNTFIGFDAGYSNTGSIINTGIMNSFVGAYAGYSNNEGIANSFFGLDAGRKTTTGQGNSYIGMSAGYNNTTGNYNSCLGFNAGFNSIIAGAGSSNTYLGSNADGMANVSPFALTNSTAIGYRAYVTQDNSLVLGAIYGQNSYSGPTVNVGIGTTAPASALHSAGQIRTGIPLGGLGGAVPTTGSILLYHSSNANTVTIQSGVTTTSYSLTLPTAQGAANTLLKNDGAGNLSWATAVGTDNQTLSFTFPNLTISNGNSVDLSPLVTKPTAPPGSVQFNVNNTSFGGNAKFIWDNTNNRLGVGTSSPKNLFHLNGTSGVYEQFTNTATSA
ncbi:MAG: hypothetical protein HY738_21615, partial [Bacteroidia bacterium]|nr:hypothetical protein [Bacteroidia bacterium]